MLVIAQHTNITDPQAFWAKAEAVVGAAPAGTSGEGALADQVADDLAEFRGTQLQQLLFLAVGAVVRAVLPQLSALVLDRVNEAAGIGLPQRKTEAALN